ncbi:MAG: tyrosine-protein phosphatase YwqE [Mariniblastus sp.]|jgi:tyrosine-protein phosphatase YwqE
MNQIHNHIIPVPDGTKTLNSAQVTVLDNAKQHGTGVLIEDLWFAR